MANNYKFTGVALATTSETTLLTAAADTTVVIRSMRVTNNTSNTPTISLDVADNSASAEYTILRTQTLSANTAVELLSVPLILEESDALKATMSSTDSTHIGISYLVIS
jgi:folylpolyglutamate synthase/dihydropteroate synthase